MSKYQKQEYEKRCIGCGNIFIGNNTKKYCCKNCGDIYKNKKNRENKRKLKYGSIHILPRKYQLNCIICGNLFISKASHSKYCSNKCKEINRKAIYINKKIPYIEFGRCEVCGLKFKKKNKYHIICSNLCRDKKLKMVKNFSWFENNKEKNNTFLKLRFEIFKRDNFTCKYCGRNIKEDKIKLHVDHIIPVSKDGKNVASNLITSCEDCNLGKNDVLLCKNHIK